MFSVKFSLYHWYTDSVGVLCTPRHASRHATRDMKGGAHKFDIGKYDTPSPFAMPSIILRDYLKPEGSSVVEFLAGDMCFTADESEYWSTEG